MVGELVQTTLEQPVDEIVSIKRDHVYRVTLRGGDPTSIIFKRARNPTSPEALRSDWAGLQFLDSLDPTGPWPRLYGGDSSHNAILLEDFGDVTRLDQILLSNDAEAASAALTILANALARLHGSTRAHVNTYREIWRSLCNEEATDPAEHVLAFGQRMHEFGLGGPGLEAELATCAAALRDPGPFTVYTHGDPCPDNCLMVGDQIMLIDFEWGDVRHALTDAVYLWLPFPSCWCVQQFAPGLTESLLTAYRSEVGQMIPEALDDDMFGTGLMAASVSGLARSYGVDVFTEDREWGISTMRQRWQVRTAVVQQTAGRFGFPAIESAAGALIDKMSREWDSTPPMPFFPAFTDH